MSRPFLTLLRPSLERLPLLVEALQRSLEEGSLETWYAQDQVRRAQEDPQTFLSESEDMEGRGFVTLPDGSQTPRLPGFNRWMWDGQICGTINFRWQTGTTDLPPQCLGHIGYEVFSWKRNRGYATEALKLMLDEVAPLGIPYVELVTNPDNLGSQKTITNNDGYLVEEFTKVESQGGGKALRFRIELENRQSRA